MALGLALAVAGGCAGWSKTDTFAELAFDGELAVDWAQSRQIGARCAELNPIAGRCGEHLNAFVSATALVHAAISAALPPGPWRRNWQVFTAGVEASNVAANLMLGDWP